MTATDLLDGYYVLEDSWETTEGRQLWILDWVGDGDGDGDRTGICHSEDEREVRAEAMALTAAGFLVLDRTGSDA